MELKDFVNINECINYIETIKLNSKDYSSSLFNVLIQEIKQFEDKDFNPRKCLFGLENTNLMNKWIEYKGFEMSDEEAFNYNFNHRILNKRRDIDKWKVEYKAKLIIKWWNHSSPQIFRFEIITPSTNESIYIIEDGDKFPLEVIIRELNNIS